jgi:hypothetical protein
MTEVEITVEITVRGSHHAKAAPERAKVRVRVARDGGDVEQVVGDVARLAERVRDSVTALHDADAGPVVAAPRPITVTAEVDARFLAS